MGNNSLSVVFIGAKLMLICSIEFIYLRYPGVPIFGKKKCPRLLLLLNNIAAKIELWDRSIYLTLVDCSL